MSLIDPLPPGTPKEIENAYYVGIHTALTKAREIRDSRQLRREIDQTIELTTQLIGSVLADLSISPAQPQAPRILRQCLSWGGKIILDDPLMTVIGGYKISPYWSLTFNDRPLVGWKPILPPSTLFVGKASAPPVEIPFQKGEWLWEILDLIDRAVYQADPSATLEKLRQKISDRNKLFGGLLYIDLNSKGVWELKWNNRRRPLVFADDYHLIQVIKQIDKVAKQQWSPHWVWHWVDTLECSLATSEARKIKFNGSTISLTPYRSNQNDTITWVLRHKRTPKRIPRLLVRRVSEAIHNEDFDSIREFLSA